MLVIILRSTDCVVCLWHCLVLLTVVFVCGMSWFYPLWSVLMIILGSTDCVVCLWHFLVLPNVVCACDNSSFY